MKIGRYRILFNPHRLFWFQTYKPTVARQWWWFLVLEEVDVTEMTNKKQFELGTIATSRDKRYRYCKFVGNEVGRDKLVKEVSHEV